MAITGFDDIASARHVRPGLTTVRQPMRQIGEEAVRILLEPTSDDPAGRACAGRSTAAGDACRFGAAADCKLIARPHSDDAQENAD